MTTMYIGMNQYRVRWFKDPIFGFTKVMIDCYFDHVTGYQVIDEHRLNTESNDEIVAFAKDEVLKIEKGDDDMFHDACNADFMRMLEAAHIDGELVSVEEPAQEPETADNKEEKKMNAFEIGESYENTFTGSVITITKRTAQFVFYTLREVGGFNFDGIVTRSKIRSDSNGDEYITTLEKYMYFAKDKVANEQTAPEADAANAPQEAADNEPKASATDSEQEKKLTLLDVHTMNLSAIEEEDITSVTVYWNEGDAWMDFADVAEALSEFGRDAEVVEFNVDGTTLHILLARVEVEEAETHAAQETATEKSEPATESPRSVQEISIAAFCKKYAEEYGFLRDNRDNVAGFNEALKAWDAFCESDAHKAFIREFCEYTGDYISSDREAAAFMLALESMTAPPMCEMETEATTKAATPVSQTEPETAAAGQPAQQEDETEMPLTPEQKEWLATTNEPMVEIADLCLDYCDDTSGSALTEEGIEALNQAILARLPQDVEWVGDKLIAPLSFDGDIDADEIISEAWADVMECGNQDYWEND